MGDTEKTFWTLFQSGVYMEIGENPVIGTVVML